MSKPTAPAVGTLMRRSGIDLAYRVVEVTSWGSVRVEATADEVVDVPGRKPRKLWYDEKRATLTPTDLGWIDDRWRGWSEVAS